MRDNDSTFDLKLSVSIVSIAILIAVQLVIARVGMVTNYWSISSLVGMISLIVISPNFLREMPYFHKWIPSLLAFYIFVSLLVVGAVKGLYFPDFNLQVVLSVLGLIGYVIGLYQFMVRVPHLHKLMLLPMWIILVSVMDGYSNFDYPYKLSYSENVASSDKLLEPLSGVDFAFHTSAIAMGKQNTIFSTGLHGTPHVPYHFGSHLAYAWMSNLVDTFAGDFLAYLYPVLVYSFLMYGFFYTFSTLGVKLFNYRLGFAFCGIGTVSVLVYLRSYKIINPISNFGSPSYLFSVLLAMWLITIILNLSLHPPAYRIAATIIACSLPFVKITTAFVVLFALGYVILRLHRKEWKNRWNRWCFIFVCTIAFVNYIGGLSVYENVNLDSPSGNFFSIFNSLLRFEPPHGTWLLRYGFLFWVYIVFRCLQLKIVTIHDAVNAYIERRALDVEVGIVIFIGSVVPTVLVNEPGRGNLYFLYNQTLYFLLTVLSILLVYLGKLKWERSSLITLFTLLLFMGISVDVVQRTYLAQQSFWVSVANTHLQLGQGTSELKALVDYMANGNFRTAFRRFQKTDYYESLLFNGTITEDLMELRNLKRNTNLTDTLLYVPRSNPFWHTYTCRNSGLILVAISEIPLIYGTPVDDCVDSRIKLRTYSYAFYDYYSDSRLRIPDDELCREAKRLGYQDLIIWEDIGVIDRHSCEAERPS